MWNNLKSGSAVLIITVLIWLTADQQVSEEGRFSIAVRLVSADPNRYAGFADPPYQPTFQIVTIGRRRQLNEFSQVVASKNLFDAVVDEAKDVSTKPQAMASREILGMIKEIAAAGLRIRNIDPPTVNIRVDEFQTVANVRVNCDFGELKVIAEPTPSKLSVRLPRFAAELLRVAPIARADAEARIRAARKPDGSFQIKVPVTFDALRDIDSDMRIDVLPAPEVQVSGQIESLTATRRKGPIQITWSVPQQVQEEFMIVLDPAANLRPDIDVNGPKDLVDQLDPRDVRAFVDVMAADAEKPRTPIRRSVQFILPTGFSMAAGSPAYNVMFQLEPRAVPPSPTSP